MDRKAKTQEEIPMLQVTTQARSELHDMLQQALSQRPPVDNGAVVGFRLVSSGAADEVQLGLTLDAARHGDEVVEHEGQSVLILDSVTTQLLGHLTLDVVETPDGKQLGLRE
jgi:Fe-S cluster assembly iron-binding protein IscA